MKGQFKVLGVNLAFEDIQNKCFDGEVSWDHGVHNLKLGELSYNFDIKKSLVTEHSIVFYGWASDKTTKAGKICLEFFPKKS